MQNKRVVIASILILIVLSFPVTARGDWTGDSTPQAKTQAVELVAANPDSLPEQPEELGPIDPAELEGFLDELMA